MHGDHILDRRVTAPHRLKEDLLRDLVGADLDHRDRVLRASQDQVELAGGNLRAAGMDQVLAVGIADAHSTDRPVERNVRDGQRRRGADHGDDVEVMLGIRRERRHHHLHIIAVPVREQRAQRAVDQAAEQDRLSRRAPLTLEKAARDLARR